MSERIAKLEALMEEYKSIRQELREEIRRLDSKTDRYFWLWVSTIAAAVLLRVFGLL